MRHLVLLLIVAGAAGWVAAASFQDLDAYGRVVHLQPMKWRDDGWPVIGVDADGDGRGEPVRTWRKPNTGQAQRIEVPPTSDEFDGPRLGLQWQWQANPRADWMSLSAAPGSMQLYARPTPAADSLWMTPNLLLQKWPAPTFVVTAALKFAPVAGGEAAGVIIFGQDYAWLGLRKTAAGLRLVLNVAKDARGGNPEHLVASVEAAGPMVYLRVTVTAGGKCRFAWSVDDSYFAPIGDEFVAKAGQWVGAKVGIFAVARPGAAKTGHADWAWFHVEPPAGSS